MTEPKPDDRVRVTQVLEGVLREVHDVRYVESDNGTIIYTRVPGTDLDTTVEVIEPTDDPSKDPVGTVRLGPKYNRAWVKTGGWMPWVLVEPGGRHHNESVAGWPIIGAVPGTPAWDAQQSNPATKLYTAEEIGEAQASEAELVAEPLRRRIENLERVEPIDSDSLFPPPVGTARPAWTGDDSEEPPPSVTKVRDKDGDILVRDGDYWRYRWSDLPGYGPYTEVIE